MTLVALVLGLSACTGEATDQQEEVKAVTAEREPAVGATAPEASVSAIAPEPAARAIAREPSISPVSATSLVQQAAAASTSSNTTVVNTAANPVMVRPLAAATDAVSVSGTVSVGNTVSVQAAGGSLPVTVSSSAPIAISPTQNVVELPAVTTYTSTKVTDPNNFQTAFFGPFDVSQFSRVRVAYTVISGSVDLKVSVFSYGSEGYFMGLLENDLNPGGGAQAASKLYELPGGQIGVNVECMSGCGNGVTVMVRLYGSRR